MDGGDSTQQRAARSAQPLRTSKPASANGTIGETPMRTLGFPTGQQSLAPTARRLLEAARRLLERSGFNSLSIDAIGREAGENKALIRYHFGDKNGLLIALVDWLMYDTLWEVRQHLARLSQGGDTVGVLIEEAGAGMLADPSSYRLYFDLLPHLFENPKMARQLAELYRAYRDLNMKGMWGDDEPPNEIKDLAALNVAVIDGLAVQILAEPDMVDVRRALDLWRRFVEDALIQLDAKARGGTAS